MHGTCALVLEDGVVFDGRAFGAEPPTARQLRIGSVPAKSAGEVIFNTGMCGYHETLTDPSYIGQLVTMTYPMIGNYGCDESWNESGPEPVRSKVKAAGIVVRSVYNGPLPSGRTSIDSFLESNETPGIYDVDTRALTLRIRDRGSVNGVIVRPEHGRTLSDLEHAAAVEFLGSFPRMEGRNLIDEAGTEAPVSLNRNGSPTIVLVDCGTKANVVRELVSRGCRVELSHHGTNAEELLRKSPDAILYSNGPGDPAVLGGIVDQIRLLIGEVPLFGICLGHQLICRALGAKTGKMKFGHHGVNHPVRDERNGRVFVTSQNHGFDVTESSLESVAEVWFRNANDFTVEGVRDDEKSILTTQFHPEASPGPTDSGWIFDEFVRVAGS